MKRSTNFEGDLSIHYAFFLMMLTVIFSLPRAICAQTPSNASGTFAAPNGADLARGDSCYTITSGTDDNVSCRRLNRGVTPCKANEPLN
jgi:hypothetical protein